MNTTVNLLFQMKIFMLKSYKKLGIKFPYTMKSDDSGYIRHELFQFASQNIENIFIRSLKELLKIQNLTALMNWE